MTFSDYVKQARIGDIVYVCDYRFNDVDNKPIRHVRPQRVIVVDNDDLPKNKRVYYSSFHFRPIDDKGKVKSTIIAPYDNTGFRAYTGVGLKVFATQDECIKFYQQQCCEIIAEFESAKVKKVRYYDEMIDSVKREMEVSIC